MVVNKGTFESVRVGHAGEVLNTVLNKYLSNGWALYRRIELSSESTYLTFIAGVGAHAVEIKITGAYKVVNK